MASAWLGGSSCPAGAGLARQTLPSLAAAGGRAGACGAASRGSGEGWHGCPMPSLLRPQPGAPALPLLPQAAASQSAKCDSRALPEWDPLALRSRATAHAHGAVMDTLVGCWSGRGARRCCAGRRCGGGGVPEGGRGGRWRVSAWLGGSSCPAGAGLAR